MCYFFRELVLLLFYYSAASGFQNSGEYFIVLNITKGSISMLRWENPLSFDLESNRLSLSENAVQDTNWITTIQYLVWSLYPLMAWLNAVFHWINIPFVNPWYSEDFGSCQFRKGRVHRLVNTLKLNDHVVAEEHCSCWK